MMKKIIVTLAILVGGVVVLWGIFNLSLNLEVKRHAEVTKGEAIPHYTNPSKALLVIDFQNYYTRDLKQSDEAIKNTNKIINKAGELDLIVIYITMEFRKISFNNYYTKGMVVSGAPGAQFDPGLNIIGDTHFVKHQLDPFSNRDFEGFLIENRVNHLIITGLDPRACIDKTIRAGLMRKYKITLISDAIATDTEETRQAKIKEFNSMGVEILSTEGLF